MTAEETPPTVPEDGWICFSTYRDSGQLVGRVNRGWNRLAPGDNIYNNNQPLADTKLGT